MILIGTSGYSFPDWVGPFYPPGTDRARMLDFYALDFPAVEVNATYYRMPEPGMIERMVGKTPAGFRFVVKLNQAMTHERSLEPGLYREFLAVLEPLKAAGKYDGLLAQFPWGFKPDAAPGQSGFVDNIGQPNIHAYDQLDLYINWQFKPMLFNLTYIDN